MFIVKRIKSSNYRLIEVGYFYTINELINYFTRLYGAWNLSEKFSFDPYSKFRNSYYEAYWKGFTKKYRFVPAEYKYIIETEKGVRLSDETLKGIFSSVKTRWSFYCTGYKRHKRGHYFRHMRTTQERRMASLVLKEEFEPNWRGKRGLGLRQCWDDIYHSDVENNNWKRYRKTQWK